MVDKYNSSYEGAQIDQTINPARFCGHILSDEVVSLTAEDWYSPGSGVVTPDTGDRDIIVDYTLTPGSVTYTGDRDIIVDCIASTSVTAGANETKVTFEWTVNDVHGTGVSVIAKNRNEALNISGIGRFKISKNDRLDFFLKMDTSTNLTIMADATFLIKQIVVL